MVEKLGFISCSLIEDKLCFSQHIHLSFQVSDIDHIERWSSCMYMALPIFMVSHNLVKSNDSFFVDEYHILIWIT